MHVHKTRHVEPHFCRFSFAFSPNRQTYRDNPAVVVRGADSFQRALDTRRSVLVLAFSLSYTHELKIYPDCARIVLQFSLNLSGFLFNTANAQTQPVRHDIGSFFVSS